MTPVGETEVLDLRSVFGITAEVTTPAAATNGRYVELDCTLDPGGSTSIHYHPEQEEVFEVINGPLEVFRDGRWQSVGTGEVVTIPPGMAHGFRHRGEMPVRFRNVHRPALGFQEHLQTLHALVQDGRIKSLRDPRSLIHMAMASVEGEPSVSIRPPQRLLRFLAAVGRRLGYRIGPVTG